MKVALRYEMFSLFKLFTQLALFRVWTSDSSRGAQQLRLFRAPVVLKQPSLMVRFQNSNYVFKCSEGSECFGRKYRSQVEHVWVGRRYWRQDVWVGRYWNGRHAHGWAVDMTWAPLVVTHTDNRKTYVSCILHSHLPNYTCTLHFVMLIFRAHINQ